MGQAAIQAQSLLREAAIRLPDDLYPGNIFFVDPDHYLLGKRIPHELILPTFADALSCCGSMDNILIAPGTYAEQFAVSGLDYLYVAGLVSGYGRPDFVMDTGLVFDVQQSQGLRLRRLRFAADGQDADVARMDSNGFDFKDLVFDGAAGMGATKALLRLWHNLTDDSYTASEGLMEDLLFRGSPGYGVAFDVQDAVVGGVGPTHGVMRRARFISNTAEDLIALETAPGVYSIQDWLFERCQIGMGTSKNKATHIDIQTNNGATNTGNVFAECFINDDTPDTTAIKAAGTGSSFIGCYNLDGVINGDSLD